MNREYSKKTGLSSLRKTVPPLYLERFGEHPEIKKRLALLRDAEATSVAEACQTHGFHRKRYYYLRNLFRRYGVMGLADADIFLDIYSPLALVLCRHNLSWGDRQITNRIRIGHGIPVTRKLIRFVLQQNNLCSKEDRLSAAEDLIIKGESLLPETVRWAQRLNPSLRQIEDDKQTTSTAIYQDVFYLRHASVYLHLFATQWCVAYAYLSIESTSRLVYQQLIKVIKLHHVKFNQGLQSVSTQKRVVFWKSSEAYYRQMVIKHGFRHFVTETPNGHLLRLSQIVSEAIRQMPQRSVQDTNTDLQQFIKQFNETPLDGYPTNGKSPNRCQQHYGSP